MSISRVVFSSKTDQHSTPQSLYDALHDEFAFVVDVAAGPTNHKCPVYFGEGGTEPDGLAADWDAYPGAKYANPPYGRNIGAWVAKAAKHRNTVMLLPARTDVRWFQEHVWDAKFHAPRPGVEVRFIAGRVRFGDAKAGAPFPSCIVVWR